MRGKASYKTDKQWQGGILKVTITGKATTSNADQIAKDVFALSEMERPAKMLIDCQGLAGRLGPGEVYFHVQNYPNYARHMVQAVAVLDHESNASFSRFHEVASANVSFNIKYFSSESEATAWLDSLDTQTLPPDLG